MFDELHQAIDALGGGVIAEHVLLEEITKDPIVRNHIFFLLVLGDPFYRSKENPAYTHRWYTEKKIADSVEQALKSVFKTLNEDELVSEEEILSRFREQLIDIADKYDDQVLKRWLMISKEISPLLNCLTKKHTLLLHTTNLSRMNVSYWLVVVCTLCLNGATLLA